MKTKRSAEYIASAIDRTLIPLTVRFFMLQVWLPGKQGRTGESSTATFGQLGSERRQPVSLSTGVLSGLSTKSF
jgi:hypothetical protein